MGIKKKRIKENFSFLDDFGDGFMDGINSIGDVLNSIWEAIKDIGTFFEKVWCGIVYLAKIFIWVFNFIKWAIFTLVNPIALVSDFINTLMRLTKLFFHSILEIILSVMKYIINTFIGPSIGSFWGWDHSDDKIHDITNPEELDQFQDTDPDADPEQNKDMKCFPQAKGKVPLNIVVATIILPPLGLMMEFGLTYWINILLCCCLTLFFYFPGLLYALVLIYS